MPLPKSSEAHASKQSKDNNVNDNVYLKFEMNKISLICKIKVSYENNFHAVRQQYSICAGIEHWAYTLSVSFEFSLASIVGSSTHSLAFVQHFIRRHLRSDTHRPMSRAVRRLSHGTVFLYSRLMWFNSLSFVPLSKLSQVGWKLSR